MNYQPNVNKSEPDIKNATANQTGRALAWTNDHYGFANVTEDEWNRRYNDALFDIMELDQA